MQAWDHAPATPHCVASQSNTNTNTNTNKQFKYVQIQIFRHGILKHHYHHHRHLHHHHHHHHHPHHHHHHRGQMLVGWLYDCGLEMRWLWAPMLQLVTSYSSSHPAYSIKPFSKYFRSILHYIFNKIICLKFKAGDMFSLTDNVHIPSNHSIKYSFGGFYIKFLTTIFFYLSAHGPWGDFDSVMLLVSSFCVKCQGSLLCWKGLLMHFQGIQTFPPSLHKLLALAWWFLCRPISKVIDDIRVKSVFEIIVNVLEITQKLEREDCLVWLILIAK